jgi:hypothetical protein
MLCIWCGHGYHVHHHDSSVRRSPDQPLDLSLQQQQQQQKPKRQAGSSAGTDLLAAAAKRLAGQAGKPANQGRSMAQVRAKRGHLKSLITARPLCGVSIRRQSDPSLTDSAPVSEQRHGWRTGTCSGKHDPHSSALRTVDGAARARLTPRRKFLGRCKLRRRWSTGGTAAGWRTTRLGSRMR